MIHYPDSADLQKILDWKGTARELAEFVVQIWCYENYATFRPMETREQLFDADGNISSEIVENFVELNLVTGGWSGNEDIVDNLKKTMFHSMYWYMSQAGGLHVYRVTENLIDNKNVDWGQIIRKETE